MLRIKHSLLWSVAAEARKFWGGRGRKIEVNGGITPSKTYWFWPICLLPMDNFATFLYFSFLFFIFSLQYSSSLHGILGVTRPPSPCFCRLWLWLLELNSYLFCYITFEVVMCCKIKMNFLCNWSLLHWNYRWQVVTNCLNLN